MGHRGFLKPKPRYGLGCLIGFFAGVSLTGAVWRLNQSAQIHAYDGLYAAARFCWQVVILPAVLTVGLLPLRWEFRASEPRAGELATIATVNGILCAVVGSVVARLMARSAARWLGLKAPAPSGPVKYDARKIARSAALGGILGGALTLLSFGMALFASIGSPGEGGGALLLWPVLEPTDVLCRFVGVTLYFDSIGPFLLAPLTNAALAAVILACARAVMELHRCGQPNPRL